jgi:O-antigen ligase
VTRCKDISRFLMKLKYIPLNFWIPISFLITAIIAFFLLSEFSYFLKFLIILGISVVFFLVRYPEITLAIFVSIGNIKGDPRLSFLQPLDLTVFLALLIIFAILIKLIFKRIKPKFPKEFILYIPFIVMMIVSLSYTPDFYVGFDKASRFIGLTGIAIISPFFLLETPTRMKRFFITFVILGILVSLNSFAMLGGYERLVAPSGLTIQLGYMVAVAITIAWFLILPDLPFYKRFIVYLGIAVFSISLVGSGARSATIAVFICMLLSFLFYRKLIIDFSILMVFVFLSLSIVSIPDASYEYLSTLIHTGPDELVGFRGALVKLGMELSFEYPVFGVGIGGYPFYSPDPNLYNWAHNIIIEISSEMGILSALTVCGIIISSFRETVKQMLDNNFKYKKLSYTVLALLIIGFITMMNTGDINCVRPMWLYMSLPFVLRGFKN